MSENNPNFKRLITRANKALSNAENLKGKYDEVCSYCSPYNSSNDYNFGHEYSTPDIKQARMYDSVMQVLSSNFVANMQRIVTPKFQKWFMLERMQNMESNKNLEEVLENVTHQLFMHLHNSNFQDQTDHFWFNYGIYYGVMIITHKPSSPESQTPFAFRSLPCYAVGLHENAYGLVDEIYYQSRIQNSQLKYIYPVENLKIPAELEAILSESPDEETEYLHTFSYDQDQKLWVGKVIYGNKCVIYEETYKDQPFIALRPTREHSGVHGLGRLLKCLPLAQKAEQMQKLMMAYYKMQSVGMFAWTVNSLNSSPEVGGRSDFFAPPPSMNIVEVANPNQIVDMTPKGNINGLNKDYDSTVMQMKQIVYDERLPDDSQVRTAYEISIRKRELSNTLGGIHAKIHYEFALPLINRLLSILEDAGAFSEGLADQLRPTGTNVSLAITSEIAQANKAEELQKINELIMTVAQIDPTLLEKYLKIENLPREIADKLGVSSSLVRSKEEIEQREMQQQEQMMQQQNNINVNQGN